MPTTRPYQTTETTTEPQGQPSGTVEAIAAAYLRTAHGDASEALKHAIADALTTLLRLRRRTLRRDRLISKGYVRSALFHDTTTGA